MSGLSFTEKFHKPGRLVLGVFILWAVYTLFQVISVIGLISVDASLMLGFVPGLLGLILLLSSGFTHWDCFLVIKPLSRKGFWVLAGVFVFALSAVLPFSVWEGWSWKAAFIYAPASGIAQELFFRSVLFPVTRALLPKRQTLALFLHSVLFGLWHIGPLFVGAPVWAVIAVMVVPFLCGLGWGWQVQHDRTVIWAMVQHSLIWVIGNQFTIQS
jgi:membrane protease YdiL (CAAX protease family)